MQVQTCAFKNCVNHESRSIEERDYIEGLQFHPFSKKPHIREKWIKQMNQEGFEPGPDSRLCSLHFIKEYFITDARGITYLRPDAIPTEFEFDNTMDTDASLLDGDDTIRCCAFKCENTYQQDSPITFHPFPVEQAELCDQWLMAMNVTQVAATKAVLCSEHFDESCFVTGEDGQRLIIADAIPSIFQYPEEAEENCELEQDATLAGEITENGDAMEATESSEDLVQKHDTLVAAMMEAGEKLTELVKQRKKLENEKRDLDMLLRIAMNGMKPDKTQLKGLGSIIKPVDEMAQQVVVDCLAVCIALPPEQIQLTTDGE